MRYFGAGTHIVVAVAGMVVVHVHLAIVEVHVRHIAIAVREPACCLTSSIHRIFFIPINLIY